MVNKVSLGDLFEDLNTPVCVTDSNMEIVWGNPALKTLCYPLAEGDTLGHALPGGAEALGDMLIQFVENGAANGVVQTPLCLIDISLRRIPGMEGYLRWNLVPRHSDEEKRLVELMKEKEHQLTEISRRYRQGIHTIYNAMFFLEGDHDRSAIESIAKGCYDIYRTTVNVEEFILGSNDRVDYDFTLVSVYKMLDDIVSRIHRASAYPVEKLKLEAVHKDVIVSMDMQRFSIALFNVIANAYHATPEDGSIQITLSRFQNDCVIILSDQGIGVEKHNISKICEPFYSYDVNTGSENHKKLGLGLPVAKTVLEQHGGNLMVSGALNEGFRVMMRLPLAELKRGPLTVREPDIVFNSRMSEFYAYLAEPCRFELF